MEIFQPSLKKPARMVSSMVEDNAIKFLLLGIGHKLLDRHAHVMRVTYQKNTRTLKCF